MTQPKHGPKPPWPPFEPTAALMEFVEYGTQRRLIERMREEAERNLRQLIDEWPGVASWNDPIVNHGVDHEVKR